MMDMWGGGVRLLCLGCSLLALLAAPRGSDAFVSSLTGRVRSGRGRSTPRRAVISVSMVQPHPEWGYIWEEENFFPGYEADMSVEGESKPGLMKEAAPSSEMDLENFFHPGAIISNFHDLPDEKRPKFVPMTLFIDEAGLTLQPDEALEMERDLQRERRRRSKERQERFLEDGMDEDLVDDSLEDVDKGADILSESADLTALPADTPTPPIEFDYNDGFDDGYSDDAAGSGGEIDEY